jgi:hypothetical protein
LGNDGFPTQSYCNSRDGVSVPLLVAMLGILDPPLRPKLPKKLEDMKDLEHLGYRTPLVRCPSAAMIGRSEQMKLRLALRRPVTRERTGLKRIDKIISQI